MNIDVAILDKINAVVELAILIPFAIDCIHIVRVKTSISVNFKNTFVWMTYCMWCATYYGLIDQYWSSFISGLWVASYIGKIYIVHKYKPI